MLKKIIYLLIIFMGVFMLTSCIRTQGEGYIPSDKIADYGFFEMPRPNNITNELYEMTDDFIEYSGMMAYEDFQSYAFDLYHYFKGLEEIKVIGYKTDSRSMGFFVDITINLVDELPLLNYDNIENTNFSYCFAFSTEGYSEDGKMPYKRIIYLSYKPSSSVNGNNVLITLYKRTIVTVSINSDDLKTEATDS